MTESFNKKEMQTRRRILRKNLPLPEIILWLKLKNRQMQGERFLRQYSIDQYVLDFYCPRLKMAIEIDGDSHSKIDVHEYDEERQHYIEEFGIEFLRFKNDEVLRDIDNVCQKILDEINNLSKRINAEKIKSGINPL